jgi:DMSO/TMAO reductase YedYZ molybdopterin-dependent catalytic subunit
MNANFHFLRWVASAVFCAAAAQAAAQNVTTELEVVGEVNANLRLTLEGLRAIAVHSARDLPAAVAGALAEPYREYTGVLLTEVLDKAGLRSERKDDWRRLYVVATASDGYKAVFSWGELFNSRIGRGALVVFERRGKPIDDSEGRIALVSTEDDRIGPRHVKWLKRIEVRRLVD